MIKQLACLGLAMLPLAACGDDGGAVCEPAACTSQCLGTGYLGGACVGGSCQCSGHPGADADADADVPRDDGGGAEDAAAEEGGGWGSRCEETGEYSYIWIADTGEGKLSKLCTLDGVEVGRYWTSPQTTGGDPSRTSVNLHGDMVVTNREVSGGPSSVTKFAGLLEDCIDRNGDGTIQTSTGPTDVKPWGEDECMLWNSPLSGGSAIGARATAWDGTENAETGEGGFVWIGALTSNQVFKLDGDDGAILEQTRVTNSPYGGVIDGRGNFWVVGAMCTIGMCQLARVNTSALDTSYVTVPCGYGITADAQGRIWTSGRTLTGSCVNRHDPATATNTTYTAPGMTNFFRGLAVDGLGSVWVANTGGNVLQISEDTVELVHDVPGVGSSVVGVAIDFQHNVWAVAEESSHAAKINPTTYEVETFSVGSRPYTYSDMTGFQLRTVILL
ncbi:MAG: hypothetical protein HY907_07685 [Deltaproteobacteria bacterium]|nr:hypothetical protein [Deltaproteobacteria bacterium]